MSYYQEDEVRRLVENWGRWPGWTGGHSNGSPMAWLDSHISKRAGDYEATIPVMGGEAADTHAALLKMHKRLSEALISYYTSAERTLRGKLYRINRNRRGAWRITLATYRHRVSDAHREFMDQYHSIVFMNRLAGRKNAAMQQTGHFFAQWHR